MSSAHGSRSRYVQGCRCKRCNKANNVYTRVRRAAIAQLTAEYPERFRELCMEEAQRQGLESLEPRIA